MKLSPEFYLPPANRAFCCLLEEMHSKVWEAGLTLWVIPPDNNNLGTASTAVRTAGKEFYWNMHQKWAVQIQKHSFTKAAGILSMETTLDHAQITFFNSQNYPLELKCAKKGQDGSAHTSLQGLV